MVKIFKICLLALIGLIALIIIASYIIWLTYPSVKLNILILDKTVHNFKYSQHRSFIWMLNNARILKSDGGNYNVSNDYYGFQPLKPLSDKQYNIKRITLETVDSLSDFNDVAYFTDAYGVYFNEWFRGFRRGGENSVIEGGINQSDFLFLKTMKDKNKLVIGEYNILGGATSELNKYKTEELFGINSSGWYAKYFTSLDTSESEELLGIAEKYRLESQNEWTYKGSGIVLVKQNRVVVLENEIHLNNAKPLITCSDSISKAYMIPVSIAFTNWIEINSVPDSVETLATFNFDLTDKGRETLIELGLDHVFPAVSSYNKKGQHIYYFSADFSNNNVITFFSRLANSRKLLKNITFDEQKVFFNEFYFPLTEQILLKYAQQKE